MNYEHINYEQRAMRDYASKVTALSGHALAVWRRPVRQPAPAASRWERNEQSWEGEGGRLGMPAARRR
jgi:hypothetical protein